jgi:hypothetical protein
LRRRFQIKERTVDTKDVKASSVLFDEGWVRSAVGFLYFFNRGPGKTIKMVLNPGDA